MSSPSSHLPVPRRDRWTAWIVIALGAVGAALLAVAVLKTGGGKTPVASTPAPVVVLEAPPVSAAPSVPAPARANAPSPAAKPTARQEPRDEQRFARNDRSHVRAAWVGGFYRIYEAAAKRFGVNWLLIASVHKQETAFSTSKGTYHGLNFANCCAGPMQFNVTNGPVTTWARFGNAFRLAPSARPRAYNHATDKHPSVYDDFDSIMAAAALLRTSGAGPAIDVSAWRAAYDYYGHDLTGVDYANQVVSRALGWGRHGFCINCELEAPMLSAVDAAWGAPVRATYTPAPKHRADALIASAPKKK